MFTDTLGAGEERLKPLNDNLLRGRAARSKPVLELGREVGGEELEVGGAEEGWLAGRKKDGCLRTFIVRAGASGFELVVDVKSLLSSGLCQVGKFQPSEKREARQVRSGEYKLRFGIFSNELLPLRGKLSVNLANRGRV